MRLNRLLQASLFWRTFVLLVALILVSSFAWLLTIQFLQTSVWLYGVAVAILLSMFGSALLAGLLN